MKKYIKIQSILPLLGSILTAVLFGCLFPSAANAATEEIYYAVREDGTEEAYKITHVTHSESITINQNHSVYEVSGDSGIIKVAGNITTTLVLNGITRESVFGNSGTNYHSPIQLESGSNVTIILPDGKRNILICNGYSTAAYVPQSGIHVPKDSSLTIMGEKENSGELIAVSGSYSAGIGGGPNQASGDITIIGGSVSATARVHYGGSVTATAYGTAPGNAAGIGTGGGRSVGIASGMGSITIGGGAKVSAKSEGNGAGIGGGASHQINSASNGVITIRGNASVTAAAMLNGAGIGGGGSEIHVAGSGGEINIYGNAEINAFSEKNGAGVGGGGSASGYGGGGGNITVFGNAKIEAVSERNGAGMGGGGTSGGTAGGSGNILIYENPIIILNTKSALPAAVDLGFGIADNGTPGILNSIIITGGNIYAEKAGNVINGPENGNDILRMIKISPTDSAGNPLSGEKLEYTVHGSLRDYQYTATTNAQGDAYLWLIAGTQLVLYEDVDTGEELGSDIFDLNDFIGIDFQIPIPEFENYTALETVPKIVNWDGMSLLDTIVYQYRRNRSLTLEAYDFISQRQIGTVSHTVQIHVANQNYDYSGDISALTAMVDEIYPGYYTPASRDSTLIYIEPDFEHMTITIYYDRKHSTYIPVELRIDDISGELIESYTIPASPHETVTLTAENMPNLSDFGLTADPNASILTATEGTDEKIVFVYMDNRAVLTISKTTIGSHADFTLPFTFEISFQTDAETAYTGQIEYEITDSFEGELISMGEISSEEGGNLTFTLQNGQEITFSYFAMDAGVQYTVTETPNDDYISYISGTVSDGILTNGEQGNSISGIIGESSSHTSEKFINLKTTSAETGARTPLYFLLFVSFLSLVLITAGFLLKRKYSNV